MSHTIAWFDLSVRDMARASQFYQSVLACELEAFEMEGTKCAVFPHEREDVAGCLVEKTEFHPSNDAMLVYFNVEGRLDQAIAEVESNGGKIIEPKKSIGPHGFRAVVLDSEGNRIALHSM
jgi:predicted enzyme related to lactoylglutathione lyase